MLKSAIRLLPGVVATMLLMPGASKAADDGPVQLGRKRPGLLVRQQASTDAAPAAAQIYDQNAMTAAHSELPLGSRVRVTMQETGTSVVVTITDRQPFRGYRIIDLSRGAAARLGMLGQRHRHGHAQHRPSRRTTSRWPRRPTMTSPTICCLVLGDMVGDIRTAQTQGLRRPTRGITHRL